MNSTWIWIWRARSFYDYTLPASRTIVSRMCHFPVNPLYIHHPSYRSHPLCSMSTAQAGEKKGLTVRAPAINRINSSQEHSTGRTHQFHYLSWTEAILSLPLCSQSASSTEPTEPIVQRHNMHNLSNALYQSLSAWNIHPAEEPHLNLFEKNKRGTNI